jgi:Leucine-rich repeat (LRR) protein
LILDHNYVKEIPDWIDIFSRLKTLSLSNNNISKISKNIGNLAGSLIYLNLGNNRFETIPKEVFNCV